MVPSAVSELLDDCIPSDPDPGQLPPAFARFVSGYTPAERATGARLATQAVERFGGTGLANADVDSRELPASLRPATC
jgi:hypothetical protein